MWCHTHRKTVLLFSGNTCVSWYIYTATDQTPDTLDLNSQNYQFCLHYNIIIQQFFISSYLYIDGPYFIRICKHVTFQYCSSNVVLNDKKQRSVDVQVFIDCFICHWELVHPQLFEYLLYINRDPLSPTNLIKTNSYNIFKLKYLKRNLFLQVLVQYSESDDKIYCGQLSLTLFKYIVLVLNIKIGMSQRI